MLPVGEFGEQIKRAREAHGWSQEQLARKLKKKCTGSYITQIEKHGRIPSNDIVEALAERLAIDKDKLLKLAFRERHYEIIKELKEEGIGFVAEPTIPFGLNKVGAKKELCDFIKDMPDGVAEKLKNDIIDYIAFLQTKRAKAG